MKTKLKLLLIALGILLCGAIFGQKQAVLPQKDSVYITMKVSSEVAKKLTSSHLRYRAEFKEADLAFDLLILRMVMDMDKERWLFMLDMGLISPLDYDYLVRASEELAL